MQVFPLTAFPSDHSLPPPIVHPLSSLPHLLFPLPSASYMYIQHVYHLCTILLLYYKPVTLFDLHTNAFFAYQLCFCGHALVSFVLTYVLSYVAPHTCWYSLTPSRSRPHVLSITSHLRTCPFSCHHLVHWHSLTAPVVLLTRWIGRTGVFANGGGWVVKMVLCCSLLKLVVMSVLVLRGT